MALTGPDLPKIPQPLKNIQQYLTVAAKHGQRDNVVSYWCRLYALQTGLKLSTKTAEETSFLLKLMDWLEGTKKKLHDNEAITNEVAAQAHLENWALKLFLYADKNDRASNFTKNVVQSFYTAQVLYDVLTLFGDLSVEASQNRKYAQWKAAYIHNCLANGEIPVPGPMKENDEEDEPVEAPNDDQDAASETTNDTPQNIPSIPTNVPAAGIQSFDSEDSTVYKTEGGANLSVEQIGKAQKFIKWASSALDYDDIPTSIMNLQKALHLLSTGEELA
ncbi:PREDICTED: vacuolar protein sorting-associated protein VTA1 homolog [Dinoponera quadriceps]|uniref:Vacuolar protein sorting-associated protein VTA1 homolog n=1 Tax=Dinoponera quadriceps TaxID=609295 RepID=A0A6P3XT75_DINQU|nr:PREDICTED: vacuolar protein sorting-associated protein VTA1 homolog [Dinoponera quadriceps]